MRGLLPYCLPVLIPLCGLGQNLVPNPSFETGTGVPAGWALTYPGGQLQSFGRTGSKCVSITGDGSTMSWWYSQNTPVTSGQAYAVRFWTCASNAVGGSCFGGFNTVYNDFPRPGGAWTNYSMVAWLPSLAGPQLSLGQVVVNGSIYIDDVEVYRVTPVHKLAAGRELGSGEKLEPGRYTFRSGYGNYGGSYARCLQDSTTSFAGFRWYMNSGSALIYRHKPAGLLMTNATLEAGIWNYHNLQNTTLQFEASTNGLDWLSAGAMTNGATNVTVSVPASLLPATEVFVRLRSTNPTQFSLTKYAFTAGVPDNFLMADGVTYFFEQQQAQSVLVPTGITDTPAGQVVNVTLSNPGVVPETYSVFSRAESGTIASSWSMTTNIAAGQSNVVSILLPSTGVGDDTVTISVTNSVGSNVCTTAFLVPAPEAGVFGNIAPNPSFEVGTNTPSGWDGQIQWADFGHTGSHCVATTGTGSGAPGAFTLNCPVEPAKTYAVRYWNMASNLLGGTYLGGFSSAYRAMTAPAQIWVKNSAVAFMPRFANTSLVMGAIQLSGTIFYDDVEVYRTIPVHKQVGNRLLGAGEQLEPGRYTFCTPSSSQQYSDYVGNYTRSLVSANTSFAAFRWYLNPGSYVLHRHELGGLLMTNAVIKGSIWNYHAITNVSLEVAVSTNGVDWQPAGQMAGTSGEFPAFEFNVPTNLFPTPEVFVLFRSSNPKQFSLMDYSFVAGVPDNLATGTGETLFFEQRAAGQGVKPVAIVDRPAGRVVTVAVPNASATNQTFSLRSQAEFHGHLREWVLSTNIPAGQTGLVDVVLPTAGFGENLITITVTNGAGVKVFDNSLAVWVSIHADDSYGERLPSPAATPVWWCDGTYKVGLTRAQPLATNGAVHISAARNEYEPFQLALRPTTPMTNVNVTITDFTLTGGGATISATNVALAMVEYVPVTELYVAVESSMGDTADPLVPITGPFNAPADTNTTVWFTVKVPKHVPAGTYHATVDIAHAGGAFTVPVKLRVYDFSLSDATHTANVINVVLESLWHQPANDDERRQIWDLYMQNMARHRVTPYLPQNFNQVEFTYDPATGAFTHDFTRLDAALSRYLDDFNFTAFQWLDENRENFGVGGTERYSYDESGNKIINPAFKPLYPGLAQPVAQHLREKGWFDKAFSYWVDEPQLDGAPATLAMVKDGFQMIGETVPGLQRLLPANTFDFPKPDLYGDVDIWVPAFDPWSFKQDRNVERQKLGEKVWPYVFIRPFSPWPNNFTDQPASSPRIRFWIGEKLNWDGELYWGINYYYTLPVIGSRNPWTTPMVRDAGGTFYGNSDGALVFPPQKNYPTNALIAGPIDSIRWEMLREGMEDREYFWVLKQLIASAESRLGTNHPSVLAARAAQNAALSFVPYPPVQPYEPDDMYASRATIAAAIEALDDGRPLIANQPVSKSVKRSGSEYLQAEAIGWPLPAIQWQHAGTNLPGGTNARLWLNTVTTNMAGDYRMIAANSAGSVTSAVVTLTVYYTLTPPQIIHHPDPVKSTSGGRAVFGVAVASVTPCTYQWLFNGEPVPGATNLTLLLTNLTVAQVGSYSVTVSNGVGGATSTAAALTMPVSPALSARLALRGFRLTIGSLVATAQVQFSTNLTDWQTLTNLPPSTSSSFFVDPVTNEPCRFYRVLIAQ